MKNNNAILSNFINVTDCLQNPDNKINIFKPMIISLVLTFIFTLFILGIISISNLFNFSLKSFHNNQSHTWLKIQSINLQLVSITQLQLIENEERNKEKYLTLKNELDHQLKNFILYPSLIDNLFKWKNSSDIFRIFTEINQSFDLLKKESKKLRSIEEQLMKKRQSIDGLSNASELTNNFKMPQIYNHHLDQFDSKSNLLSLYFRKNMEYFQQLIKSIISGLIIFSIIFLCMLILSWVYFYKKYLIFVKQYSYLESEQLNQHYQLLLLSELTMNNTLKIIKPIKVLKNFIQIIRKKTTDSKIQQHIESIEQSSDIVIDGLNNISHFALQEAKNFNEIHEKNLKDIIQSAIRFSSKNLLRSSIHQIESHFKSNILVQGDALSLKQVFINFFQKSADALYLQPERWIRIEAIEIQDKVIVSFTDSQPNIITQSDFYFNESDQSDEDVQPSHNTKGSNIEKNSTYLTQLITKLSLSHTTSLGIQLAFKLINEMGGELKFDALHNKTKFIIELPKFGI